MKRFRLEIELVPESAWGNNLSKTLPKKDWDKLRDACYERAGHACVICGKSGETLDAHEVWDFHSPSKTQTLIDIVALCKQCHGVKHIKNTTRLGYEKQAKEHFMRINKCDGMAYAAHYMDAEYLYNQRNQVDKWTLVAPTLGQLGGEGVEVKQRERITILNPYDGVDWTTVNRVKAALHTHTVNSLRYDSGAGNTQPNELANAYELAGFGALVITDHDFVSLHNGQVLTLPGNELSRQREHLLSYGTNYQDELGIGMDHNVENIAAKGGIVYLAHLGRHENTEYEREDVWWTGQIVKHYTIKGIEVLNTRRFSRDHSERLWDAILSKTMPYRNVFGIGTDDNHSSTDLSAKSDLGAGYTVILLQEHKMNNKGLFEALSNGLMYFCSHRVVIGEDDNKARPNEPAPKILSIEVDKYENTITVHAENADKIEWVSGLNVSSKKSKVVKRAYNNIGKFITKINVRNVEGNYVRFRLIGKGGQTLSQPFGIVRD